MINIYISVENTMQYLAVRNNNLKRLMDIGWE